MQEHTKEVSESICWTSQNLGNRKCWKYWKIRAPTQTEDLSYQFLEILNMGSRSIKNTKWQLGNFQVKAFKTIENIFLFSIRGTQTFEFYVHF